MASLQGLVKKCRQLEEKEKWKELSEAYNQLGRMFSERGKYKDALLYHTKLALPKLLVNRDGIRLDDMLRRNLDGTPVTLR